MAACCAAYGVRLSEEQKKMECELFHERVAPWGSLMVTIVLLKEAVTVTIPCGTCLRSFFLNFFPVLPFFSGVAPPAAGAFAMIVSLCQFFASPSPFYAD